MAQHNRIGAIGEDIATKYLNKHGYIVTERNYSKKTGEIDIVCAKNNKITFFEVKTVSYESIGDILSIRPEENLHTYKLLRLYKTIEIYLTEKQLMNVDWVLKLITVKYSYKNKQAKVEIIDILG